MRYKVRTETATDFELAKRAIADADADVYVSLDRRCVLSTGDLSDALKRRLQDIGAQIVPEYQYQVDAV